MIGTMVSQLVLGLVEEELVIMAEHILEMVVILKVYKEAVDSKEGAEMEDLQGIASEVVSAVTETQTVQVAVPIKRRMF